MTPQVQRIKDTLRRIYGDEMGEGAFEKLFALLQSFDFYKEKKERRGILTEQDVVLICYGDSLRRSGEPPLRTLHAFAKDCLKDVVSTIHILPFFPYTSDDGFAVTDYAAVRQNLGTWEDIQTLAGDFKLMFDLVLNHVSAGSGWFQRYLRGENGFKQLAIEVDPSLDLSRVVRPRSLPLLSEYSKDSGETVHLWTTFSSDQIDLNFKDPEVLALIVEILILYIEKGASVIRLDAIAYLWKEIGTACIHLPQTHEMVKLLRTILDMVAPRTLLITETNVPHEENISYFGNGNDEAQLVYNFTLPPLVLHAFVKEDATLLSRWARGLDCLSPGHALLNFTASHDGIGVRPLEGILPPAAVSELAEHVIGNGGRISYKKNSDGSESPYEFNISYVDALCARGSDGDLLHAKRFLAAQSIQLVLPGVPAVYIHSMLGSRNWLDGVRKTGRARSINRESLDVDEVLRQLKDPGSFRSRIFNGYTAMIRTRRKQRAFQPGGACEVLRLDSRIFAVIRSAEGQRVFAVTNVSSDKVSISLPERDGCAGLEDLITGTSYPSRTIQLHPYQYVWLGDTG